MHTPPEDLDDRHVADALSAVWGLAVDQIDYAPVGFGSHHWSVESGDRRWFATVDDLRMGDRDGLVVASAIATSRWLADAGAAFVVAPIRTTAGAVVHALSQDHLLTLYPYVDFVPAEGLEFRDDANRRAVVDVLAELHGVDREAAPVTARHDLTIPVRRGLEQAMTSTDVPWDTGPFGESSRRLLSEHADSLRCALDRLDAVAAKWTGASDRMVVTHGEPHQGNILRVEGDPVPKLIDWETARVAHPERDLWRLAAEDDSVIARYEHRAGVVLEPELLDGYRLWWDLCDVSIYIADFRASHGDTEDNRIGWHGLVEHLDPARWF